MGQKLTVARSASMPAKFQQRTWWIDDTRRGEPAQAHGRLRCFDFTLLCGSLSLLLRAASAASIAAAGPNEAVPYRSPMPVPLTSVKIRTDRPDSPRSPWTAPIVRDGRHLSPRTRMPWQRRSAPRERATQAPRRASEHSDQGDGDNVATFALCQKLRFHQRGFWSASVCHGLNALISVVLHAVDGAVDSVGLHQSRIIRLEHRLKVIDACCGTEPSVIVL